MEDSRVQLQEFLGLSEPVSNDVLRAVAENESYARYLMAARDAPAVLQALLASPPRPKRTLEVMSTAELFANAAQALGRWAMVGFRRVDAETYARRLAACDTCDQLIAAPSKAMYRLVPAAEGDARVCAACGCVASTKARVPTEACPLTQPGRPHLTRWGEPREAV